MQHLADLLPRGTQSLLDRSWLLTVYERKALATSDHPVYVVPNEELTRMGMGTGIENATVIHAPLTRRHSLAMYNRPPCRRNSRPWGATFAGRGSPPRRSTATPAP